MKMLDCTWSISWEKRLEIRERRCSSWEGRSVRLMVDEGAFSGRLLLELDEEEEELFRDLVCTSCFL